MFGMKRYAGCSDGISLSILYGAGDQDTGGFHFDIEVYDVFAFAHVHGRKGLALGSADWG